MSKKFIIADPEKCTGCRVCELVCSGSKDKTFNPRMSRIRAVKIEPAFDTAMACRLCNKPSCVRCCPRKALRQDEQTGVIIVDETQCNGCGWCVEVCEFGAVTLHPVKKVVVMCDLCGEAPPCVEFCISKALELTTLDAISEKSRRLRVEEWKAELESKS